MEFISLELKLFLSSVGWGIILVILYDCLRILRRLIKHNRLCTALEDILYWSVSAVLIFRMMYLINDGAIRGFAIVGVLIGMVLYHYSISDPLVNILSKGIHKCFLTGKKAVKIIMKPFVWMARRFRWLLVFFAKRFRRPCRFARKSLKKFCKQVKIAVVKK